MSTGLSTQTVSLLTSMQNMNYNNMSMTNETGLLSASNMTSPETSTSGAGGGGGPSMTHRFWMESIIGLTLGVFGIFGNLLALVVLSRQKPRVTTTVVLMVLVVVDNLVLVAGILLRSLRYMAVYTSSMDAYLTAYPQLFLILYPWVYIFRLLDMWLTVLLTVDRYIVVCRPLHANTICTTRRAIRDIIIVTLCAVIFSIPRFFEHKRDSTHAHGFTFSDLLTRRTYTVVYRILGFFLLQYVVPLALMIALNVVLLISLWKANAERAVYQMPSANSRSSNSSKATRSVTMIVVIVVLICVMTNSLALVAHLLWSLEQCWPKTMGSLGSYRRYMAIYSNMAISINSASNLPTYYCCSKRFRQLVKDTLISCCRPRRKMTLMDYSGHQSESVYLQSHGQPQGCPSSHTTGQFRPNYIAMTNTRVSSTNQV